MTLLEFALCVVLILFSSYLSASEIALFSLSRFQLRAMKERFRSGYRKIRRLLGDPGGLLVTILVLNEITNVSISTLISGAVSRGRASLSVPLLPGFSPWAIDTVLGILVTTPIIVFFCEITPKVVGARANQLVATATIGSLEVIYEILRPLRVILRRFIDRVARLTGAEPLVVSGNDVLKESDFMLMLEEGHKEGAIQENELELIKNVFEFDDTSVAQVFTPLVQVQSMIVSTTLKGALTAVRTQRYSRIPIVSNNRRQVLGILYSKDLLRAKLEPDRMQLTVAEIMRKPLFVNPETRLNALFRKFKQQKTHMAVVQGPNLETLGVITMSDILDTLFEDLFPDEEAS